MPGSTPDLPAGAAVDRGRRGHHVRSVAVRVGLALGTVVAVSIVTFAATGLKSPDATARAVLGRNAPEEQVRAFVAEHRIDDPLPVRYLRWAGGVVQGDWGTSVVTERPIAPELAPRLGRTLLLAVGALLLVVPLGIGVGVALARRWGEPTDLAATGALSVLSALPEFVVGIGMILVLSVVLRWLPSESATAIAFGSGPEVARAYLLPILTLVVGALPFMVRLTRGAVRDSLRAPHTRAANLRGLAPSTVVWRSALPAAAVTVLTAAGLTFVHLLSGTLVVENLFGVPGIGQALVQAVATGDVAAVQSIGVLVAVCFVAVSLLTDLAAVGLDPRLRGRG